MLSNENPKNVHWSIFKRSDWKRPARVREHMYVASTKKKKKRPGILKKQWPIHCQRCWSLSLSQDYSFKYPCSGDNITNFEKLQEPEQIYNRSNLDKSLRYLSHRDESLEERKREKMASFLKVRMWDFLSLRLLLFLHHLRLYCICVGRRFADWKVTARGGGILGLKFKI